MEQVGDAEYAMPWDCRQADGMLLGNPGLRIGMFQWPGNIGKMETQ